MHHEHGETAVRRIQGVLSLAKKYGAASVEDACAAALEVGSCEYRFVRPTWSDIATAAELAPGRSIDPPTDRVPPRLGLLSVDGVTSMWLTDDDDRGSFSDWRWRVGEVTA
jgi:hypothetical protein